MHKDIVILVLTLVPLVYIQIRLIMLLDMSVCRKSSVIAHLVSSSQASHIKLITPVMLSMLRHIPLQLIFRSMAKRRVRCRRRIMVYYLWIKRDVL